MLRSIAKTVIGIMAAGCFWMPIARGQGHPTYTTSIPFAFYVSDTLFPAGTYHITQSSQYLLILQNARRDPIAFQLVSPKELTSSATTGQLTFNQYGSSYFLREFSAPNKNPGPYMASTILRGGLERRTAKKFMDARKQEVALSAVPPR